MIFNMGLARKPVKTGPEKCAEVGCTDDQCRPNWYWPVRALRLIRAVDA